MDHKEQLAIYHPIKYKYTNNIFKDLPDMIITYLYAYPEKFKLYFNQMITIEDVLEYIAKHFDNSNQSLIDCVIEYVEGCHG